MSVPVLNFVPNPENPHDVIEKIRQDPTVMAPFPTDVVHHADGSVSGHPFPGGPKPRLRTENLVHHRGGYSSIDLIWEAGEVTGRTTVTAYPAPCGGSLVAETGTLENGHPFLPDVAITMGHTAARMMTGMKDTAVGMATMPFKIMGKLFGGK